MKTTIKSRHRLLSAICLALAICIFAICGTSCSPSVKYQQKVKGYLDNKYGEMKYTLLSCEQNRETNGRYEVSVYNEDTKESFDVYVYSTIMITDSYSVDLANREMNAMITEELKKSELDTAVSDVQWLDRFNDNETNYSFRTVELDKKFELSDVKSLYSVTLSESVVVNARAAANYAISFCEIFSEKGANFDSVNFIFKVNGVSYSLQTSTSAISRYGAEYVYKLINSRVETENSLTFKSVNTIEIECTLAPESTEAVNNVTSGK